MHLSPPLPFQKVSRICSFIFISLKLRNRTTREGEEGASFKSKEIFVHPSPSFSIISQKNLLSTFFSLFLPFLSQLGCDRTDPYIHTQATPRPLVRLSCQQTNKKNFEIITLSLSHPSHTLSLSIHETAFLWGYFCSMVQIKEEKTAIHNWYNRYISYRTGCVCVCVLSLRLANQPNKQTKKYGE